MWLDRKALTRPPTTAESRGAGRAQPRHCAVMPLPRPCPLSAAERARKHRRREREGLQHLGIDVPHAIIELLIAGDYLTETDAADPHAIEKAVETFLADQVRHFRRPA